MSLSLTLNIFHTTSSVSIVNFEYVIAGWDYSISICPFESGKCGQDGNNLQKFEYLEKESFFDKIKTLFIVFEWLSFGEKNKNLIKNSGHKL